MRSLPIANPINRFASTTIEYDGEEGVPSARLEVYEERATKKILSDVDSPDVGMKWSLNPYRGCHARLRVLLRAAVAPVSRASAPAPTSTARSS